MVKGILSGVVANFLSKILSVIDAYVTLQVYKPNAEIRVAFSAILKIQRNGKYILVRNLHRPETFCPFGGVYKYKEDAQSFLDEIDFRPHIIGNGDMIRDIRGYLPRKNLSKLLRWYYQSISRESYTECLTRELKEELAEVGIHIQRFPADIQFRRVRHKTERPKYLESINCYQFRIFEVYEISSPSKQVNNLLNKIHNNVKDNKDLISVSSEEIRQGRSNGGYVIGPHSHYLLNHKRYRDDDPMFLDANNK